MSSALRRALPVVIAAVLFVAALEVLRVELHAVSWRDLTADVWRTPPARLLLALALTALNYATLTGYDLIAFVYIGKRLPRRRIAAVSFLAYAISNSVGLAMLSGASVRYRIYTRWGVTAEELSRIVFSYSATFWLGLFALGGVSLVTAPIPDGAGPPRWAIVPAGWLLMLLPAAYLALTGLLGVRLNGERTHDISVRLGVVPTLVLKDVPAAANRLRAVLALSAGYTW